MSKYNILLILLSTFAVQLQAITIDVDNQTGATIYAGIECKATTKTRGGDQTQAYTGACHLQPVHVGKHKVTLPTGKASDKLGNGLVVVTDSSNAQYIVFTDNPKAGISSTIIVLPSDKYSQLDAPISLNTAGYVYKVAKNLPPSKIALRGLGAYSHGYSPLELSK